MATWAALCAFILEFDKENTVETSKGIVLTAKLPSGRSQKVVITHRALQSGTEWAVIESVVGRVEEVDLRRLIAEVSETYCGGVSISESWVTLRHCLPIANLALYGHFSPPIEIFQPLFAIAVAADRLEELLTGRDRW